MVDFLFSQEICRSISIHSRAFSYESVFFLDLYNRFRSTVCLSMHAAGVRWSIKIENHRFPARSIKFFSQSFLSELYEKREKKINCAGIWPSKNPRVCMEQRIKFVKIYRDWNSCLSDILVKILSLLNLPPFAFKVKIEWCCPFFNMGIGGFQTNIKKWI